MSFNISDKARTLKKRFVHSITRDKQQWTGRYEKLPQRGEHFRTLILQPGEGDEPLRCTLQTSLLGQTPFEAISYVWGSETKDREIRCGNHSISITSNLWTVLRHVRSDHPRVLWADSICINQDDYEEKSYQVAMMGRIYRAAERVLIFLGVNDFGRGASVDSLLKEMSVIIKDGLEYAGTRNDAFPWPDDDAPILKDTRWESFSFMLEQRWFDRGWVVQEAAVARRCLLLWGKHGLNWEHVMQTYHWTHQRAPTVHLGIRSHILLHETLYQHYYPDIAKTLRLNDVKYSLPAILYRARHLQFSDPRDRIFAFAALAHDLGYQTPIHPDYRESFLHICRDFAINYICTTEDTELLDYVRHNKGSLRAESPSWVPRWDSRGRKLAPRRSLTWPRLTPRAPIKCEPVIIGESILKVRGVIMDDIQWVSKPLAKDTTLEELLGLWQALTRLETDFPYPPEQLTTAFLNAMICGKYSGVWSQFLKNRAACAVQLLEKSGYSDEENIGYWRQEAVGGDRDRLINGIKGQVTDMRLIVTNRGYVGLAPSVTEAQDKCAIIFGCATPCILRKANRESQYQFLGSSMLVGSNLSTLGFYQLGEEGSKDWVEWDVEEQDIELC